MRNRRNKRNKTPQDRWSPFPECNPTSPNPPLLRLLSHPSLLSSHPTHIHSTLLQILVPTLYPVPISSTTLLHLSTLLPSILIIPATASDITSLLYSPSYFGSLPLLNSYLKRTTKIYAPPTFHIFLKLKVNKINRLMIQNDDAPASKPPPLPYALFFDLSS